MMSTRSASKLRTYNSANNTTSFIQTHTRKRTDEEKKYINDRELNNSYERARRRISQNKDRVNDFINNIDNKTKPEMTQILSYQQKVLSNKKLYNRKHEDLNKYISKRLKTCGDNLLMNTTHEYRAKKEVNEFIEKNQPIESKFGHSYWVTALRRPVDFEGVRYSYINLRDSYNPFWQLVKETVPNETEIMRAPYKTSRELDMSAKNDYFKQSLNKLNIKVDNSLSFKNVGNLSVSIF
jgi:hypothetical protein